MKNFNFSQQLYCIALALFCGISITKAYYLKELPPDVHPCEIYKPGFLECETICARTLAAKVVKGLIPGIAKDIGTWDPIYIKEINYEVNNALIKLKANITDIYLRGYSNMTILKHMVSKNDFNLDTKLYAPLFRIEFKLNLEGTLLEKPVKLNDNIILEMHNTNVEVHATTRLVEKKGVTFFDVEKVKIDLNPARVTSNKKNLFDMQSSGMETTATFNVDPLLYKYLLKPLMTKEFEKLIHSMYEKLLLEIPAKFFVSDIPTPAEFYGI